jgi:hypothetical protein
MNITSRKIIGGNGKVREHIINEFNSDGLKEKTDFFEENGDLRYSVRFEYNSKGNCISEHQFDSKNNFVGSIEWKFDEKNREIEQIEKSDDGEIWEWYEKQFPEENIMIYLSKNKDGIIEHKTISNKLSGIEERFDSNGDLYAKVITEFDKNNRIVNRKTFDTKGKVTQEDVYDYIGKTEKWTLFVDGKFTKTEERTKDDNGNDILYVRKDDSGKSTEYVKWTYDNFGNAIKVENGIELNKPTNISEVKIEYRKEKNVC